MSITRTVVRNVVRDVVRAVVRGESDITRYFTEFNSITQTYGEFTSPIAASSDFEWELSYAGNGADFSALLDDGAGGRLARIDTGGALRVYAGTVNATGTTDITDGKLYTLGGKRIGTTLSCIVGGVVEGTITNGAAAGTMSVSTLLERLSQTTNGIPANFKFWKDGDRTTGTLVVDSPMDDAPDATEFKNLADPANPLIKRNFVQDDTKSFAQVGGGWAGPELWTFGDYVTAGNESQNEVLLGSPSGVISIGGIYLTDGTSEVASSDIRLLVAFDTVRPDDWPDLSTPAANTRLQLQYTGATPPPAGQKVQNITTREFLEVAS